ncbi:MAG: Ni/Fe hydrogenase subunit beta, partial [Candidatus Omnitrophica bacterium]|nr:Ni/Fe hydrogenase subunit beta [Candidatus Omnitrophota bacterium]
MENYVILKKEDFNEFIKRLGKIQKVVAPVKRGLKNFAFEEVTSGEDISLTYIPTILPPKKYFMPQEESLAEFNKKGNKWETVLEYEELTIFGVHTCDLAGIQCLNMVFSDAPKDINYIVRKNKITIIGFECNAYCDEYATCAVVDSHHPKGGYDLFFTELKDVFIIHINTLDGSDIIKKVNLFDIASENQKNELKALRAKKKELFKDEVNVKYKELKS